MPSRSHSSVQRTRSLPVHTSPQSMLMFQQPGRPARLTAPSPRQRGSQDAKTDAPANPAGKCLGSAVATHSFELMEAFPFLNCALPVCIAAGWLGASTWSPQSQLQSDGDIFDTSHISTLVKPEISLEGFWGEVGRVPCVVYVCGGCVCGGICRE